MSIRLLSGFTAFLTALALLIAGCAGQGEVRVPPGAGRSLPPQAFFAHIDAAVETTGTGHGAWARVPGHPYLRSDRFLYALKDRLENEDQKRWWVDQMQALDLKARTLEIENLPLDRLRELAADTAYPADARLLTEAMRAHSDRWLDADRRQPDFTAQVREAVINPEEYSTVMRVAGLYPLAALPVAYLTHRARDRFRSWHATAPENLPVDGTLTTYAPQRSAVPIVPDLETFFNSRSRDPFGLPQFTAGDSRRLAAALAPVITQDVAAGYDRIGEVTWQASTIHVNTAAPTLYYYLSRAFLKGVPVIQVNYVFWYPGRRGPNPPAIERGPLDGLTLRVTLDPAGRPAVVDIMNNCGCYHFFLPKKEQFTGPAPAPWAVDAFVPGWMPAAYPAQSLQVRISSGWHQVEQVGTTVSPDSGETYRLVSYDALESLLHTDGRRESLFYPTGIAKDSERVEPYLLFSMGIPKVGSMRQRGHHPLKLVGKSTFDDPWLMDKSLIYR